MADLIIKDARVITGGTRGKVLEKATIVIEHGTIIEVAERARSGHNADRVIDGRGRLVVPGLVNAHVHTDETLAMNTMPDTIRHIPWFEKWILPYYETLTEEDRYWSAMLSDMLMLKSGTTCYADSANRSPDLAAKAAEQVGIRAFVAHWISDIGKYLPSPVDVCVKKTRNLLREHSNPNGRVRAIASVIGLNQCSNELYLEIKKLAEEFDSPVTTHEASGHEDVVRSVKRTGLRPVENLAKIGFLSSRSLLSHVTDVSRREVGLLRKSGTNVVLCPSAELKKGKGLWKYGKLPLMLRNNLNMCLGTDTANSSNHLDVLRTANLILLTAKDLAVDPEVLEARRALDMITDNAGKSLGMRSYGTISKGSIADIALFDLDSVEWFTNFNPVQGLLYGNTPKAYASIVNGEIMYENGKFTRIKQEEVLNQIRKRTKSLLQRIPKE